MSKCKICKQPFQKRSMSHKCCSVECAAEFARMEREKKSRKEVLKRKDQLKTRSDWIKTAQVAFNAYIRYRDKDKSCICCGEPLNAGSIGGGFDCGHYRSTGSAPHLRFDERNAHGQRKHCNRWRAGRAVDYRIGLIKRLGIEQVEALEADQTIRKWAIDELKEITETYRNKLKELKKMPGES